MSVRNFDTRPLTRSNIGSVRRRMQENPRSRSVPAVGVTLALTVASVRCRTRLTIWGRPEAQRPGAWQSVAMAVRPRYAAAALWCLLGAACSSSSLSHGAAAAHPGATCSTPTSFGTGGAPNELHGTSHHGQLWGLALGPGHIPPRSGDELKIVWRMTGSGPLRVTFTAPNGRRRPLVFGPEAHAVSDYHRPGDEWGTGFHFSAPGCWHIKLTRDSTSGDVWLNVRP
jgi:hypothetical protein